MSEQCKQIHSYRKYEHTVMFHSGIGTLTQTIWLDISTFSQSCNPLFANSSRSVSAIDAKFGLITAHCMGSVIRG